MKIWHIILIVALAGGLFFLGRATMPTFEHELVRSRALVSAQQEIISQQAAGIADLKGSLQEFSVKIDSILFENELMVERMERRNRTAKMDHDRFLRELDKREEMFDELKRIGLKLDL